MDPFTSFMNPTPLTNQIAGEITKDIRDPLNALKRLTSMRSIVRNNGKPLVEYRDDIQGYKMLEFFAHPDTTLANGWGDCEDMCMLEIAMIKGLPVEIQPINPKLVIGKCHPMGVIPLISDPFIGMYHAWVETDIGGVPYIADPVAGDVFRSPDIRYKPLFAVRPNGIEMMRMAI